MIFGTVPSYGDWSLAVIYTLVFALIALFFHRPESTRDWRAFVAFTTFLAALFIEMYVFPLTIYLLSGWTGSRFLRVESLPHDVGHVLEMMFDWRANPPLGVFQIASTVLILGGFLLLVSAWSVLHKAQQLRQLARTGVYAHIRHPEYVAFVLVMSGFLLRWPTLITLAMFPILVFMYVRLARREEQEALAEFGDAYQRYLDATPAFVPRVFPRAMKA